MSGIIVPVILCGGSGTRLWPASQEHHPKQFLKLFGDFSLLQETAQRGLRLTGADPTSLVTVTLDRFKDKVRAQIEELDPSAAKHILAEPHARNTAAAIAFAASYIEKNFGPAALMLVLPSDHHIGNEIALTSAVNAGMAAAQASHLVTFGIQPDRPETGYGYIKIGEAIAEGVKKVKSFVEKPDSVKAQTFIDSGDYLWNSGMFLFSAGHVLNEYKRHAPNILNGITSPERYAGLSHEPFDKAIMEKSGKVAVVPCDPSWSDIGSWESLWQIRGKDANGNVIDGFATCHDTKNCLIQTKSRLITCAGLENIIVIETDDAILIADRNSNEALKILANGSKKVSNDGTSRIKNWKTAQGF